MQCLKYFCFLVMILLSDIGLAASATGNEVDVSGTEIKSIRIEALTERDVLVSIAYQYDGKHGDTVYLNVEPQSIGNKVRGNLTLDSKTIKKGEGVVRAVVQRYSKIPGEYVTELLKISLFVAAPKSVNPMPVIIPYYNIYEKTVPITIIWPTLGVGIAKVIQKDGNTAKQGTNIALPVIQIKSIKLVDKYADRIVYEVQYQYDGESGDDLSMIVTAYDDDVSGVISERAQSKPVRLFKGDNTETIDVMRIPGVNLKITTDKIEIKVDGPRSYVQYNAQQIVDGSYAEKTFLSRVTWADVVQVAKQPVLSSPGYEERYKKVVYLIDKNIDQDDMKALQQAKQILDQLLIENPKYVPAYIQLSRYQIRMARNQKGVKEAEQTLNSAIKLDMNNAEIFVVLGDNLYWQNRFDEALSALDSARKLGTSNLWLYVNYARVFIKKGHNDRAVEYYEKLTNRKSYDLENKRPLMYGYGEYIELLMSADDFAGLEKVYERRQLTFPSNGCYLAEYAAFELFKRSNYEKAIRLGENALQLKCSEVGYISRQLSYAYLVKWAQKYRSATRVDEKDSLYQKAMLINSDMSDILYKLSNALKTEYVVGVILRSGVKIDDSNHDLITATGLSVQYNSIRALKKLVDSGADVNARQGKSAWSLLMMAANNGNEDIVKYLLDNGADVNVKSVEGYSAIDIAQARGYKKIVKLLQPRYQS